MPNDNCSFASLLIRSPVTIMHFLKSSSKLSTRWASSEWRTFCYYLVHVTIAAQLGKTIGACPRLEHVHFKLGSLNISLPLIWPSSSESSGVPLHLLMRGWGISSPAGGKRSRTSLLPLFFHQILLVAPHLILCLVHKLMAAGFGPWPIKR